MTGSTQKTTARYLLLRFLYALLAVCLLFGRQIGIWANEFFRMEAYWEFGDSLNLLLAIILCALLAVGISLLLDALQSVQLRRIYDHLFLIVLGTGFLSCLPGMHRFPLLAQTLWIGLVASVIVVYVCKLTRVHAVVKSACLLFSPLSAILFYQILSWSTFAKPPDQARVPRPAATGVTPVFLFLFDGWSYLRSAPDGDYLPSFSHLRELCAQSFVFRQAHSEGPRTWVSVPKILYQTDGGITIHNSQPYFNAGRQSAPSRDTASLFRLAQDHGYITSVVGFYLPYKLLLGSQVDHDYSLSYVLHGHNRIENLALRLEQNFEYWPDPISYYLLRPILDMQTCRYWAEIHHATQMQVLKQIATSPQNSLLYVHSNIPHPPLIFRPDGSYRTFNKVETPRDYLMELRYLDSLIGQTMAQLRAAGKFEDALIVIMADHSWRDESDPHVVSTPDWIYRVPLIIKWPGQKSAHLVDHPFSLIQLKPLLELAFKGGKEAEAAQIIQATSLVKAPSQTQRTAIDASHAVVGINR